MARDRTVKRHKISRAKNGVNMYFHLSPADKNNLVLIAHTLILAFDQQAVR